jgi:hypothetical protein
MTVARKTLKHRIAEDKITAEAAWGAPDNPEMPTADPYTVTLRRGRRRMTVPFYMGAALCKEPTAADVLNCLCLDAMSYTNTQEYENWCANLGYSTDSRKAYRIYEQVRRQTKKLEKFLGDLYQAYLWETESL